MFSSCFSILDENNDDNYRRFFGPTIRGCDDVIFLIQQSNVSLCSGGRVGCDSTAHSTLLVDARK